MIRRITRADRYAIRDLLRSGVHLHDLRTSSGLGLRTLVRIARSVEAEPRRQVRH